ncbi:MAG: molybdopterin-dependent oxidoreductase, partial [Desulfobacteraceae bacterium]
MIRDTVCRMCSACCPVSAHIEGGRLVRVERKSFLPPQKRLRCPKLASASEVVYSQERVLRPLIRKPGTAAGAFMEASWDQALDLVGEKFQYFKNACGAETVAWLRGMAADWGAQWDYANRLMNAFGSPNTIGNGSVCHVAREMAHTYTYGAMTLPRPKEASCIVVWGKNDRNTAPGAWEAVFHALEHGAWLIVIDPVRTPLADRADVWLQVKPGYDGPLAMAMIHEVVETGLYDQAFVREHSIGFDELRSAAAEFPAESVGPGIWLDPADIKKAAGMYASAESACIIDGNGLDMQVQVFQTTRAVSMLRALTGNLDKEGGDFIPQPVPVRDIQLRERRPEGVEPVTRDYLLFNDFSPSWGLHAQSCLVDAILEERPYPVKMLVVQSGNPAVTMPDSKRVQEALSKLEFLVVIDLFKNRTAHYADVILPAAGCFEKTQLNRAYMRNSPVILQDQVIEWRGESRPDWKIVFDLGRRLGLEEEFPWQTAEEAIDYQLAPSGITVDMLRQNPDGVYAAPLKFEKYRHCGFATPSGKVEFFSDRLKRAGYHPVPFMDGRMENPISFAGTMGEDALIGMSGERSSRFTHSQFRNIPSLVRREAEPRVDISPEDAARRGIADGQLVEVSTPRGRVKMRARISDAVHTGSIRIAWGWGEVDPVWGL